jgi:lipoprotein-releasing system permease protein
MTAQSITAQPMSRWLPVEWVVALRFLREGRMQTLFIITAVAIGVGVIVFMSAMLASLQANFLKRVLTTQPHIQLVPPDEVARPLRSTSPGTIVSAIVQRPAQRIRSIDQWQTIRRQLAERSDIVTISPSMSASALAVRGDASRSITLTGIDPDVYFKIVRIPDYIVQGQSRVTSDDILIGIDLAKDLGVALRDKLNVTAANGAARVLTIAGIFDLGNKGANMRSTFVALRTAQTLAKLVGGVTTIDLTVTDIYAADSIAQAVQAETGIEADSWIKTNAQFFTAVNAQQLSNTVIRVFVALSVAFGIASVLVVSVIQRSKDIGILRAMGTSQGQILRVFLLQGALLGFFGAMVGATIGGFGVVVWHTYLRQADGSELFPLVLEPSLFVEAVLLAALTGVAAAAVPALSAAKLDPVVAIRG